jgi:hypothetical protein
MHRPLNIKCVLVKIIASKYECTYSHYTINVTLRVATENSATRTGVCSDCCLSDVTTLPHIWTDIHRPWVQNLSFFHSDFTYTLLPVSTRKKYYLITFIVELQKKKPTFFSFPSCSYFLFQYSFLPVFLLHSVDTHLFLLQFLTCRFALQF